MKEAQSLVNPDEITFNTIIKGCALNKDVKLAFSYLEEMRTRGLTPNDVTFNSLIDCCVRSGNMDKAWDLFTQMQDNGIVPDNFTFSTLIKGIKPSKNPKRDLKDLERAFSLLEQIKANKTTSPDEILYNCLIDACIRLKDFHRAVSVFNEMNMSEIKPSSVTYGILIKSYGYANQLDNAFNAFV